ncbi:MAG: DUF1573 domain-containing protein [Thermoguttaceae bacterium]
MRRLLTVVGLCVVWWAPAYCFGQPWAEKMFETRVHEFGSVGRGAKAEYEFKLSNTFIEDVEIAGATVSCGCTSVEISKRVLKTYESGSIVARFNTDRFVGRRGATITVRITRPMPAMVQLRVDGTIHTDLIVTPASADLGTVDRGTPAERRISVRYAGQQALRIVDVKTGNPHLKATIVPSGGVQQASYELLVQLDAQAPSGYIRDNLLLVTTNSQMQEIPVMVEARVMPEVTVTPSTLFLGVLKPGERVSNNLVVRGKRPFTIKSIRADHEGVEFGSAGIGEAKMIHVIPMTVVAGSEPGALVHRVRIETDLSAESPQLSSYAVVQR